MTKYCSDCGIEIEETDKFCISCGKQVSVRKIEATGESEQSSTTETAEDESIENNTKFPGLAGIVIVLVIMGLAAFYLLDPETRTVAVSVPYQEAINEIRYSGTLKDTGLSTTSWSIKEATSYKTEYTGKDLWGSAQYTVNVCWKSSCIDYPQINDIGLDSKTFLIGYQTKYRTESKSITKTRLDWLIGG